MSPSLDEGTIRYVADHVIAYLNSQRGWWIFRPPAVVGLSMLFFVLGGQTLGSLFTLGYTAWVITFWRNRLVTIVDMVNVLGPIAKKNPAGLDDLAATYAVFTEADIAHGSSRQARLNRLHSVTKAWFTASGPGLSYDCGNGHGAVCGHRTSTEARSFWKAVSKTL